MMWFKLAGIILGLIILAFVVAYIITLLLHITCFGIARLIILVRRNGFFHQFKSKGYTSQNCGDQSWIAQQSKYLVNIRHDLWWTPIWYINKFRNIYRITKYQSYKPTQDRPEKSPTDFIPNIINKDFSQPTPETHCDKSNIGKDKPSTKRELYPYCRTLVLGCQEVFTAFLILLKII